MIEVHRKDVMRNKTAPMTSIEMLAKRLTLNYHVYTGHSKEKVTKRGTRANSRGDTHNTLSPCKGSGCLRLKLGGGEMGRL